MSARSSDQISLIIKLKIKILNSWRNITSKCYHINSLLCNYIAWPLDIYHPSRQAIRQQTFARFSRHPSLRARRVMVVLWCEDIQSIIPTCINKILWCSWTKYCCNTIGKWENLTIGHARVVYIWSVNGNGLFFFWNLNL